MNFKNIEEIKKLTEEQQKFLLFKNLLNIIKDTNNEEYKKKVQNLDFTTFGLIKIGTKALVSMVTDEMITDGKNKFSDELNIPYNSILDNWIKLSSELKLTNSLELSNLFSYLLWNGYFSKTKVHTYKMEGRTLLNGYFSLDLMNGIGVCLNYSDMLKDFLLKAGINSSIIINRTSNVVVDNEVQNLIKRNIVKPKINYIVMLLSNILKNTGNHACALINENGKLYIYDPTNLICAKIENFKTASIIDGKGIIELKPYFSYGLANSDTEKATIEKLFNSSSLESPYNKEDINLAWINCVELFNSNNNLIEDCYNETKPNIDKISYSLEQCKKKARKKV